MADAGADVPPQVWTGVWDSPKGVLRVTDVGRVGLVGPNQCDFQANAAAELRPGHLAWAPRGRTHGGRTHGDGAPYLRWR